MNSQELNEGSSMRLSEQLTYMCKATRADKE